MVNCTHVALDGPAASGKSTIAKKLALRLGFVYIDTGAMYRAVTLKALTKGIDLSDESQFDFIKTTTFDFRDGRMVMDNEDVTERIRETEISNNVSLVSSYLIVRNHLVEIQRKLASNRSVVMDGRDIGTNVLPNATYKFFLTASIEERAKRRHLDNLKRGIKSDLETLKEEIARRDRFDTHRKHSPLKPADDAKIIDTSHMRIDEVVEHITEIIREVENHGI
jgi:cytidylate kinase